MDSPDSRPTSNDRSLGLKDTHTETISTPGRLFKFITPDDPSYSYVVSYPVEATLNLIREKPEFALPSELAEAKIMFYKEDDKEMKRKALALQREGLKKLDEQNLELQNPNRWPIKQTEVDDIESAGRGRYFSYGNYEDSATYEDWIPTKIVVADDQKSGLESGVDPKGNLNLEILVTKSQIFINKASEHVSLNDLSIATVLAYEIGNQNPDAIVRLANDVCSRLEAKDLFAQINQTGNKKVDPAKITSDWMGKLLKIVKNYEDFRKTGIII